MRRARRRATLLAFSLPLPENREVPGPRFTETSHRKPGERRTSYA